MSLHLLARAVLVFDEGTKLCWRFQSIGTNFFLKEKLHNAEFEMQKRAIREQRFSARDRIEPEETPTIGNVMRELGIDGNTPVAEARQKIMTRLNEPKPLQGYESFTMLESGDSAQKAHLLRVDSQKRMWVYALPAAERINK